MKISKPQNVNIFLAILSFVTGITVYIGLSYTPVLLRHFTTPLKQTVAVKAKVSPTPDTAQPPTAINIPKINKNLPIKPAHVTGNTWDMFDDAVAWLSTSATPGRGNVILYAHDRVNLWANLYVLQNGDAVDIQQGTTWKHYIVTGSRAIQPTDVQAVLSDKNQLTMYTCEGSFDQKRRVVYAAPVD